MKPKKESHAESIERILLYLALLAFVWVLVPSDQIPALIRDSIGAFFSWAVQASDHFVGYVGAQIVESSAAMQVGSWAVLIYAIARGIRWLRATVAAAESRPSGRASESNCSAGTKETGSQARI